MTTLKHFERSNDAAAEAQAIANDAPGTKEAPFGGGVLAASGDCGHLSRPTLADYGIGYGDHGRGTQGIFGNLEEDIQGRTRAGRRAPLRIATHRALRPACKTSTVGEESRRVA